MVWLYSSPPFDEKDKKLLKYLEKKTNKKTALNTVRILSLHKFLVSHKFKSAKDIEESALYSKNKSIFTPKQARKVFDLLKKSGGAHGGSSESALILDKGVRILITYIQSWLPDMITQPINGAYEYITIIKRLKESPEYGPLVEIGLVTASNAIKTTMVTVDDAATATAGPFGIIVELGTGIVGLLVVAGHIMADELGEATLAAFLAIPAVGPPLYDMAQSTGRVLHKAAVRRKEIVDSTRIFLGDGWAETADSYIPSLDALTESSKEQPSEPSEPIELSKEEEKEENPKPVGARRTLKRSVKRFSTKRRKTLKWKR